MYLVFDIGATNTRVGLSSDGWTLGSEVTLPTDPTSKGPETFLQAARHLVGSRSVTMAAGGIAGLIDRQKGMLIHAPNLPQWGKVDMEVLMAKLTPTLILENDAALVGLGEAWVGSGISEGIMAYVTISTGVNGARIVEGVIDPVTEGFEIGHQFITEVDGVPKTLQELISGHNLQQRYGRLPSKIDDPAVWQTEIHYLALGLYNAMTHWSPEMIVVGGSLMRDISLDKVTDELKKLPKTYKKLPILRPAALGNLGGLHGGLALIRQALAQTPAAE